MLATGIYTLSLHDALPILVAIAPADHIDVDGGAQVNRQRLTELLENLRFEGADAASQRNVVGDRKSTRLNSSHMSSSYAVFCLKKKTPPAAGSFASRAMHP